MLYPRTIKLADDNLNKANCLSRNEFIEKSINFYSGYLNSQENIEFINEIITNTIKYQIDVLDESLSSLLFKLTVELNMTMSVLALHFDIDDKTLEILRKQSIKQVQESIGKVNLNDILNEFKEKEE